MVIIWSVYLEKENRCFHEICHHSTVQLNSNLTLARVRLAETGLIFKYTRVLAVSAQMSLW